MIMRAILTPSIQQVRYLKDLQNICTQSMDTKPDFNDNLSDINFDRDLVDEK